MTKSATTTDQQLALLKSRGLTISDTAKAHEILHDIGYYRLGFYLFPFEKSYPDLRNRTHEYIDGALLEDAVNLYYFDFDLRLLLMRYLNRIEIAFRTSLIYYLSNKYNSNPIWFVCPAVVNRSYARDFEQKIYTSDFKRNPIIHRHHQKNPNDRFAPAWKTLEFMTFGAIMKLYEQLKEREDKIFGGSSIWDSPGSYFRKLYAHYQTNSKCLCPQFIALRRALNSTNKSRPSLSNSSRIRQHCGGTSRY